MRRSRLRRPCTRMRAGALLGPGRLPSTLRALPEAWSFAESARYESFGQVYCTRTSNHIHAARAQRSKRRLSTLSMPASARLEFLIVAGVGSGKVTFVHSVGEAYHPVATGHRSDH